MIRLLNTQEYPWQDKYILWYIEVDISMTWHVHMVRTHGTYIGEEVLSPADDVEASCEGCDIISTSSDTSCCLAADCGGVQC